MPAAAAGRSTCVNGRDSIGTEAVVVVVAGRLLVSSAVRQLFIHFFPTALSWYSVFNLCSRM